MGDRELDIPELRQYIFDFYSEVDPDKLSEGLDVNGMAAWAKQKGLNALNELLSVQYGKKIDFAKPLGPVKDQADRISHFYASSTNKRNSPPDEKEREKIQERIRAFMAAHDPAMADAEHVARLVEVAMANGEKRLMDELYDRYDLNSDGEPATDIDSGAEGSDDEGVIEETGKKYDFDELKVRQELRVFYQKHDVTYVEQPEHIDKVLMLMEQIGKDAVYDKLGSIYKQSVLETVAEHNEKENAKRLKKEEEDRKKEEDEKKLVAAKEKQKPKEKPQLPMRTLNKQPKKITPPPAPEPTPEPADGDNITAFDDLDKMRVNLRNYYRKHDPVEIENIDDVIELGMNIGFSKLNSSMEKLYGQSLVQFLKSVETEEAPKKVSKLRMFTDSPYQQALDKKENATSKPNPYKAAQNKNKKSIVPERFTPPPPPPNEHEDNGPPPPARSLTPVERDPPPEPPRTVNPEPMRAINKGPPPPEPPRREPRSDPVKTPVDPLPEVPKKSMFNPPPMTTEFPEPPKKDPMKKNGVPPVILARSPSQNDLPQTTVKPSPVMPMPPGLLPKPVSQRPSFAAKGPATQEIPVTQLVSVPSPDIEKKVAEPEFPARMKVAEAELPARVDTIQSDKPSRRKRKKKGTKAAVPDPSQFMVQQPPPSPAIKTAAPVTREELVKFYQTYDPDKISTVDGILKVAATIGRAELNKKFLQFYGAHLDTKETPKLNVPKHQQQQPPAVSPVKMPSAPKVRQVSQMQAPPTADYEDYGKLRRDLSEYYRKFDEAKLDVLDNIVELGKRIGREKLSKKLGENYGTSLDVFSNANQEMVSDPKMPEAIKRHMHQSAKTDFMHQSSRDPQPQPMNQSSRDPQPQPMNQSSREVGGNPMVKPPATNIIPMKNIMVPLMPFGAVPALESIRLKKTGVDTSKTLSRKHESQKKKSYMNAMYKLPAKPKKRYTAASMKLLQVDLDAKVTEPKGKESKPFRNGSSNPKVKPEDILDL